MESIKIKSYGKLKTTTNKKKRLSIKLDNIFPVKNRKKFLKAKMSKEFKVTLHTSAFIFGAL